MNLFKDKKIIISVVAVVVGLLLNFFPVSLMGDFKLYLGSIATLIVAVECGAFFGMAVAVLVSGEVSLLSPYYLAAILGVCDKQIITTNGACGADSSICRAGYDTVGGCPEIGKPRAAAAGRSVERHGSLHTSNEVSGRDLCTG